MKVTLILIFIIFSAFNSPCKTAKMLEDTNTKRQNDANGVKNVGKFRKFLAQFLAVTVKNLLLFDLGLCYAFPGIIIPALSGILNDQNAGETLRITAVQASWLGSISYICQPLGSVLSALIIDPLGRKSAMMVVNIPLGIAWFMMYRASSISEIYAANILLGLGVGLMEAPTITYIGEICEPPLRSVLLAYSNTSGTIGIFMVYLLNTMVSWRMAALVCMFVPIITLISLCFVPETPLWLLSKRRCADAEKALRWLRGWVSKESVGQEFQALQRYSTYSRSCHNCIKNDWECSHAPPTLCEKFSELRRKQTLKPLFIVMSLFFFAQFSGIAGMAPYFVQIFKAYASPLAPDEATAILTLAMNLGNILFLCLIQFTGKRRLYFFMMGGVLLCAAITSIYGFIFLPKGYSSFSQSEQSFPLKYPNVTYIPFISMILWGFCTYGAVNAMAWQMISEVFPFKSRGLATGLSAASNYVMTFVTTKTYLELETYLSIPGTTLFNCCIAACGLILMYEILPETENRTLEDIEKHFSDDSKKITDYKIPKSRWNPKVVSSDKEIEMIGGKNHHNFNGNCYKDNF